MSRHKAIGRRGRVLRRANDRAQRRFHDMFEAHVWSDPYARATILYQQSERLVRRILRENEPVTSFWPVRDETDQLAQYWNRGA